MDDIKYFLIVMLCELNIANRLKTYEMLNDPKTKTKSEREWLTKIYEHEERLSKSIDELSKEDLQKDG